MRFRQEVQALPRRRRLSGATTFAAIAFYVGVAGLGAGGIRLARAAIEKRGRDRTGVIVAGCGVVAIGIAIALFASGPKEALPF